MAPGRLGHHPAGTMTGARGASLDWDRRGAGNTRGAARGLRPPVGAAVSDRALRPSPRKHGPRLSLGDEQSPWREPRWNADRRAHPAGCEPHRKMRRMDCALVGVPLPFLRHGECNEAIQFGGSGERCAMSGSLCALDCFVALLLAMTKLGMAWRQLERLRAARRIFCCPLPLRERVAKSSVARLSRVRG